LKLCSNSDKIFEQDEQVSEWRMKWFNFFALLKGAASITPFKFLSIQSSTSILNRFNYGFIQFPFNFHSFSNFIFIFQFKLRFIDSFHFNWIAIQLQFNFNSTSIQLQFNFNSTTVFVVCLFKFRQVLWTEQSERRSGTNDSSFFSFQRHIHSFEFLSIHSSTSSLNRLIDSNSLQRQSKFEQSERRVEWSTLHLISTGIIYQNFLLFKVRQVLWID
jgi:hypothetical protein